MAEATVVKAETVDLISIYPSHKLIVVGGDLPKTVVNGKVVFGNRVGGKIAKFKDNEATVPAKWMEFTSETTGEVAGLKHTLGYGNEFVEKDKFVKDLKAKRPWANSFLMRLNRKRAIITPSLPQMEKMDLFGVKPD